MTRLSSRLFARRTLVDLNLELCPFKYENDISENELTLKKRKEYKILLFGYETDAFIAGRIANVKLFGRTAGHGGARLFDYVAVSHHFKARISNI